MNKFLLGTILLFLLTGCKAEEIRSADVEIKPFEKEQEEISRLDYETLKAAAIEKYEGRCLISP